MAVVLDTLFRFHPSLTINNYDFKVAVVFSYWVNVIGSCSIINKLSDLHSPNLLQIEFTCRIKKKKKLTFLQNHNHKDPGPISLIVLLI